VWVWGGGTMRRSASAWRNLARASASAMAFCLATLSLAASAAASLRARFACLSSVSNRLHVFVLWFRSFFFYIFPMSPYLLMLFCLFVECFFVFPISPGIFPLISQCSCSFQTMLHFSDHQPTTCLFLTFANEICSRFKISALNNLHKTPQACGIASCSQSLGGGVILES
jgi:hypothetical protein